MVKNAPKEWQPSTFLNGIDRIDNTLGYLITNCAPCCQQCNWAKKDLSSDEFLRWIRRVYQQSYGNK